MTVSECSGKQDGASRESISRNPAIARLRYRIREQSREVLHEKRPGGMGAYRGQAVDKGAMAPHL